MNRKNDAKRLISAFTALESAIVIEAKKGAAGGRELDLLLHRARIEIVVMDPAQVELRAWLGGPMEREGTPRA